MADPYLRVFQSFVEQRRCQLEIDFPSRQLHVVSYKYRPSTAPPSTFAHSSITKHDRRIETAVCTKGQSTCPTTPPSFSHHVPIKQTMPPLTPHWQQPSHPAVQEVVINEQEFTTMSYSKVTLPPFAVFAKLSFPPCTVADEPTYATVQMGRHSHFNLNSDLLYINHSCEPSLIFDTGNMNVLVGPKGLKPGDELTFFYPSTEWHMNQPFTCLCGHPTCRGTISGAKDMTPQQLHGVWLSGHIRDLLDDRNRSTNCGHESDATARALKEAVLQAEKVVEAARLAMRTYAGVSQKSGVAAINSAKSNGFAAREDIDVAEGLNRRGPTSRELSGEMGGDTVRV